MAGGLAGGDFASLLRARRQGAGLTQQELAERSGLGVRTLRELEKGRATRPQRNTVELLADALELTGAARVQFEASARGIPTLGDGAEPAGPPATIALPPPPALVGRDRELRDVAELLEMVEMVTLVGLAGVGKSCLALAVVHRIAERFTGGVAGVAISDVSGEADVLAAVATVFGVARAADLPRRSEQGTTLLLVDGADRSPDATATAVRWLRGYAPTLRILMTSRHPVDVPGSVDWPLAPLEVPPSGGSTDLDTVSAYPATALFLQRLRQVRADPVRPEEAPILAELVRRLGGLPLALELAAARGRILELPEILDRYRDRVLDLGAVRSHGETLRDAVAGSYRLLDEAEQRAFRQLSIFNLRWSLELAEALLSPVYEGEAVEALMDRLVSLGLVSVRGGIDMRFRLPDVVHDFAAERCAEAGELPAVQVRHARVLAGIAARTAPELVGPTQAAAILRLDHLASDLQAALTWASQKEPNTGLRIAASLSRWWRFRGRDREGHDRLRDLLSDPRTADARPVVRAWGQLGVAMLAAEHGEGGAELPAAEAALKSFVSLGNVPGELATRSCLCVLWQAIGGYDESRRHGEAVLALATRTGRVRDVVVAQNNLTWHDIRVGDLAAATRRLNAVAGMAAQAGDERLRALAHANLAEVTRLAGRYGAAAETGRRTMAKLTELGDPGHRVRVLGTIGLALAQWGRVAQATAVLAELPDTAASAAGTRAMIGGYLALGRGDRGVALRLFSAAAEALAGHHDARDVVEALVGAVASCDDPGQRAALSARLELACERGGVTLLPRERALLRG
jgi:predicted ATPase/DNA-binding XRE family transcriptional regulator